MDIILTFLFYFLVFALIRSLLAADFIKNKAENLLGNKFRFYRITYNIISIFTFAPVFITWMEYTGLTPPVYSIPEWLLPVILIIRLLAVGMFAYAAFQTDILEFTGIKQIEGKASNILITGGAYGIVRHPLYTGGWYCCSQRQI